MPARRSTGGVVPVMDDQAPAERALKFDEPLSWKAGRPIPVADLLRRLRELKDELEGADQEDISADSLRRVAQDLSSTSLLSHKDGGVRALSTCCIVDILRLCAPAAPYNASQIKTVFTAIIQHVLPNVADTASAYQGENLYVLKSLAQVKSVALIVDVPASDMLITALFSTSFDVASNVGKSSSAKNVSNSILQYVTEVLITIVEEAGNLPSDVVETIVAQFLRYDTAQEERSLAKSKDNDSGKAQSDLKWLREVPPAYSMAKAVCDACPDRMSRYISHYFHEIIMDASSGGGMGGESKSRHRDGYEDDSTLIDRSSEGFKDLAKAHKLIQELWRASPAVLQNVIPQLDVELNTENVQLRMLATQTLGEMLAGVVTSQQSESVLHPPSSYPPFSLADSQREERNVSLSGDSMTFIQTYPTAYASFLGRQRDKSAVVRSTWTTAIGRILLTTSPDVLQHSSDKRSLVDAFAEKFRDPDERVRLAAIKAIDLFSTREIIDRLPVFGGVSQEGSLLFNLTVMVRNPKPLVRGEAIKLLARIWSIAAGEIAARNEVLYEQLAPIPSKLFDAIYVNEPDINTLIDSVLHEWLLPMTYPNMKAKASENGKKAKQNGVDNTDELRVERLLVLIRDLEPRPKRAFLATLTNQTRWISVTSRFLDLAEGYNGGTGKPAETKAAKQNIGRVIDWIAPQTPDAPRTDMDLWKFVEKNDRRTYQLFRFCMSSDSDHRTVLNAIKEIRRRIESGSTLPAQILDTINNLLYKVSLLICNKSHIPAIMQISQTEQNELCTVAQELLKEVSTANPAIFKARVKELCKVIQNEAPTAKRANDIAVLDALKACQTFARKFPDELPSDASFPKALLEYTRYGQPAKAAKYAAAILLSQEANRDKLAREIIEHSCSGFKFGQPGFLAKLGALSQAVLLAPAIADEFNEQISDLTVKDLLLHNRHPASEADPAWVEDTQLDDETRAKVLALKISGKRLLSGSDKALAEAPQLLKLLITIVKNDGELSKKEDTPAGQRSRLVLTAAQLLLKLNTAESLQKLTAPEDFNSLATVTQDTLYRVRLGFTRKLRRYLAGQQLPSKYYAYAFLTAFEPQQDLKDDMTTWLRSRASYFAQQKSTTMEYAFLYLISVLAHHPDFGTTTADLVDFAKYLVYFLQTVATEDNISFLYYLAQRVKQAEDAIDPKTYSENLYYLSDLAQAVIRKFEAANGWTMHTWPGTKSLPASIFSQLKSHAQAQEIANQRFLPDELDPYLEKLVQSKTRARKRKSENATTATSTSKKQRTASVKKEPKSRLKKAAKSRKARNGSDIDDDEDGEEGEGERSSTKERRRSGRATGQSKSYIEIEDSDGNSDGDDGEGRGVESESGESGSDEGEEDGMSD